MSRLLALTREISPSIVECELTHLTRQPIDLDRARTEHLAYEDALRAAGCRVERLSAGDDMPDSVFIEDTAVVVDEVAVIARPGALSRRVETAAVVDSMRRFRKLRTIVGPGTLDGGDVLVVGRQVFVGRSSRTNEEGCDQLTAALEPYDYQVRTVEVRGCLHLKSAVTALTDDLLLVNAAWLPAEPFAAFECIEVHPEEAMAANALRVGDAIIVPAMFPRTRDRIERQNLRVLTVEAAELAKAEGAVTCCSLVFRTPAFPDSRLTNP
jgi:dimethylargininase